MVKKSDSPAARAAKLDGVLGHAFRHPELLEQALTHPSWVHEAEGPASNRHYEALEFLGDAVLGFLIAELIYRTFPDHSEGQMSRLRASLVSARSLGERTEALGLAPHIRLGRGERAGGAPVKKSILADVFESLLGAIYLDGGIRAARAFVRREFGRTIRESSAVHAQSWDHKTRLQEIVQSFGLPLPQYRLVREEGPPHRRTFEVEVVLPDGRAFSGVGASKKQAQQSAAEKALEAIEGQILTPLEGRSQ